MTGKQQLFVDYYCGEARGNASMAARLAGYVEFKQDGYRLKKDPAVWKEIERRLDELTYTAKEVLERISQHANATLETFLRLDGRETSIDLTTEQAQASLHLLKKVKTRRRTGGKGDSAWTETDVELELVDVQAALALLARYHKLLTDKVDLSGDPDKPFVVKVLSNVQMAELR